MFENNFLELKPNYAFASLLLSAVGAELLLILLQKTKGIRMMLPNFLRRKMYNYERLIKEDGESSTTDIIYVILFSDMRY